MTLETTKPIRGYLLIEPEVNEVKKKAESVGIYLKEDTKFDLPQSGMVIKVGEPLLTEYGATIPSPVKKGDKIIYKKWGGNEVKIDDKEFYFVRFDDILGLC